MSLVEIDVGHGEVMARSCVVEMGVDSNGFCYEFSDGVNPIGWTLVGFWISHGWTLVLLGFALFFFFFFNMGFFFLVGFWWAVGSGGVVGMVEARWW